MSSFQSRSPLKVMFVITSMPVGGAETLLVNLVRRVDRSRFFPMICCLKEKGVLGEEVSDEIPVFENLIRHKFDIGVAWRLKQLLKQHHVDAVITVGAGDKMFWGRLAARMASVPVVLSALHSTGWPDGVGKLNRLLTPITDGFIACAENHAEFLKGFERFPDEKVFMIPNGIDMGRFQFDEEARANWRTQLDISKSAPVAGIVAALRPEKNHSLFLRVAASVAKLVPETRFVIAGDGPERAKLEGLAEHLGIASKVHFLGSVSDIPGVLSMLDLFTLTSHNEAKPVSILEAMACRLPVVATDVGSVSESVVEGETGFLVQPGEESLMCDRWLKLLTVDNLRSRLGTAGRQHVVDHSSLECMVEGYMELVESVYWKKRSLRSNRVSRVWEEALNPGVGAVDNQETMKPSV